MSFSTVDIRSIKAESISLTEDALIVELSDGRTISVPLSWYPRLVAGNESERKKWRLIGDGQGIHWSDLDEDISVENLIMGQPSQEKHSSLSRWLQSRNPKADD